METNSRKFTNKLLELVEQGFIDAEVALRAALKYMSEEKVKNMCEENEFLDESDFDDADEDKEDISDLISNYIASMKKW